MQSYEVPEPILNTPFAEPTAYWYIREGETPEKRTGRRAAIVFPPRDQKQEWDISDGLLRKSEEYPNGYELTLVNLIRERLAGWRKAGYPGVTRTTLELLQYWRRDGRKERLFFAQLEGAETVILLKEARNDFLQGLNIPLDMPSEQQQKDGTRAFERYACKMATGSGKTTVMAMLAAWSILNKVNDRSDARFSDVVLAVCPNVTIRHRLLELDPNLGDGSLYRKRDLVPTHLMPRLREGRVIVTNWHNFEPKTSQLGGVAARVTRTGKPVQTRETIHIGQKTTTARGARYLTQEDYERHVAAGLIKVVKEERDTDGTLKKAQVEAVRYIESDTSVVNSVLGRDSKQNILVLNDEAHHAYRIRRVEKDEEEEEETFGEDEEAEDFFKEATVWIEGLDRINKLRGINFCVDLSATPYYLGRVGQDTNKPFPWVVSDFGLIDSIESGLVKIPQLAIRDTSGAEYPHYFNIWNWILPLLTPGERGGKKGSPKAEAILKYANHPIAMLGGLWEELRSQWVEDREDKRPPVFIIVCKNTKIAKVLYEWLAEDKQPLNLPPAKLDGLVNSDGKINTIRVDSRVVHETDSETAKADESLWMRFTLDTVGKAQWPADLQGRPIYPPKFEELAEKLERPLHPPGRDIRCIVSVGMLTEGWDCTTVTHIIGLRPFMSQLLCEQVVGRGLRRTSYDTDDQGKLSEEVAKVLGVPFEVIPFKTSNTGGGGGREKRHHIHAVSGKSGFEIRFPRLEGYTQAIRNRITIDWDSVPSLRLAPGEIPPEVEMKALSINNEGHLTLSGPGKLDDVGLKQFRSQHRMQELVFDLARGLTKSYLEQATCEIPAHRLFPQVAQIVQRYVSERVRVVRPADIKDLFLSPYYGWLIEILVGAIRPDQTQGEAPEVPRYETSRGPGSTADVDFWTSRDVREAIHSHVNYVVADTKKWEQSAAYHIDKHPLTAAFVKNAGLGLAIPYFHNGEMHDYIPDFIVQLKADPPTHLILETKGYDPLEDVKGAAAERWVAAVNADGSYGRWAYAVAKRPEDAGTCIASVAQRVVGNTARSLT